MVKKTLSSLLALSLIFGGAAALPDGVVSFNNASAATEEEKDPVENKFYNATGKWEAVYSGEDIQKLIDADEGGFGFGENEDGTYTFGCNIQVGHAKNLKVTLEVTSTKDNLYNGADADPVNSTYMYTVQPSWSADAPADLEKHPIKFMYDEDGNPVMKKGAVDVNEWDSGPSKFNGQWAQFVMTDDDLSAITIKATFVADGDTTWEYHPYDTDKTPEENIYIVFNFMSGTSVVTTTVASDTINGQIEKAYADDSGDTDSSGSGDSDSSGSDSSSSDSASGSSKSAKTSIAKAKVTGLTAKTYTGKAIKPAPTVKLGKKTLKKGTDYTVSYKNNKKIGKATVTIKGKGDYKGTITKTFKINPKKTSVKKATSPKTKQLKVTYKKVAGVTGYQVSYSTSKNFTKKTTKTVTVKGAAKTSKTVKSLKKGKKYYVKVRSYKTVSGTKYYSGYTKVKSVKVK
ncbi:MAG: hypothetical protein IJ740_02835 [Ruminococcus sp.]|nr:hypothetical protein [Ruminococcus sp.]